MHWLSPASVFSWGLLLLLYGCTAAYVLDAYMSNHAFEGSKGRSGFEAMLEFDSHRPFVYRILTPWLINQVAALVPDTISYGNEQWFTIDSPALQRYLQEGQELDVELGVKWHIAYGMLFGSLLATLFVARGTARLIFPRDRLLCDYGAAMALLMLPLTFHIGGYMYDFPELLLLSLCLYFLVSGRTVWFFVAFVAAVLNKESNVMLAAYYLAYRYGDMDRKQLMIQGLMLGALGLILVVGVRLVLRDNPGTGVEMRLWHNIEFWFRGRYLLGSFSPIAPLMRLPSPGSLVLMLLLVYGVFSNWRRKPAPLRRLVWVGMCTNIPLFLAFSYENEVRALAMLFPVFYLAVLHTVVHLNRSRAEENRPSGVD